MLFQSTDEMLVTACEVIKVMTLHEESIKVRTSPSATHVRAYMVVVTGEPSGTQPATPDIEDEPHLLPINPHLGGRTPCQLQPNLRDDKVWQLMEDLYWEVALRELNAPVRDPPLPPLGNPVGNGDPMWMTRRSPFQEGGGNPEDNHFDPLLPPNWMMM